MNKKVFPKQSGGSCISWGINEECIKTTKENTE